MTFRLLARTALILSPLLACAQTSAPPDPWAELDARPMPTWWTDAKFGIFIHWGVYAVPAFAARGDYAEWYWRDLQDPARRGHAEVRAFHDANYGPGATYADFVPRFTAELFDPAAWAETFQRSGAKYVVLTSKHHDGFTLWPSAEANRSWGRPWNSVDTGPRRDLLGDLSTAVRAAGLRMGIYYSLYEWFNPLYQADPDLFVQQHMIPQFKDVVTRYQPEVIFSDGEWEHPHTTWHSTDLVRWLFTESPVRDEVVVNDRWGRDTRHHHGDYFTTEYGSGLNDSPKPWEENRGMGHSYGFNRAEDLAAYNTGREFVLMLADIVSRGGNFLLNVGPTADGRIPVIMQQRLREIGDWLAINGEAIYGATTWTHSAQWSEGEVRDATRGRYKSGYDILKLTVDPDPGFAVKQVMFTRKGNVLYAICPVLPAEELVIRDLELAPGATVTLLGREGALDWRTESGGIVIDVPVLDVSRDGGRPAYTFRIDGLLAD